MKLFCSTETKVRRKLASLKNCCFSAFVYRGTFLRSMTRGELRFANRNSLTRVFFLTDPFQSVCAWTCKDRVKFVGYLKCIPQHGKICKYEIFTFARMISKNRSLLDGWYATATSLLISPDKC